MKNNKNMLTSLNRITLTMTAIVAILAGIFMFPRTVLAGDETDEILNYEITVDVNDDATLNMIYHIDWLVLDSNEYGPLTWANIGIPNSHVEEFEALSENIDQIDINGSYAEVYFDDSYYAGEVVSFDFRIRQDYMYLAHSPEEEMCKYTFTPGWFDDFKVDKLTINWNGDKVSSFTPECLNDGEYLTWETSLAPGEKYTITTVYPSDAFAFNLERDSVDESSDGVLDTIVTAIGVVIVLVMVLVMFAAPFGAVYGLVYFVGRGFSQLKTEKKITRTKVVYYPSCPGCGAVRKEGEKFCTYCGRSFIQSEEIIEEKDIPATEKALLGKSSNGEYRYSSSPNTYMRVNVVNVAPPRPASTTRSSSSHHSSCAHSSCACACACACAGGGRAGCTTKDFYKTKLKLRYFEDK